MMSGYCDICGETVCVCRPATNDSQLDILISCLPSAPFKERVIECVAKLKQERDEAVAMGEVMRGLLNAVTYSDWNGIGCADTGGKNWFDAKDDALSLTGPDALREIQAMAAIAALTNLRNEIAQCESDEVFIVSVLDHIDIGIAAKRKGE